MIALPAVRFDVRVEMANAIRYSRFGLINARAHGGEFETESESDRVRYRLDKCTELGSSSY